ncbi:MAG: diguanylate cyclase [Thermoanaerobaculia bacterium]|nr:diguanylate cyclase [Thermoanaerobaculia bacterium]
MRVLIADDSPIYRTILRAILEKKGFIVEEVEDGVKALQVLTSDEPPQIAVLDWVMPGLTGPQICRRVRGRGDDVPYIYLFLVSAKNRIEDLKEGLASGADDYLSKPFVPDELEARISVAQRTAHLHAELAKTREKLWNSSVKDELTEIWNRRGIEEQLETVMERDSSSGRPLSLIMMDIDHFKRINDEHGHPAGDEILHAVASRICSGLRGSDQVGRFGGEEFMVVLPETDAQQAIRIAERIRQAIARNPVKTEDGMVDVSASLGVATAGATEDVPIAELITRADDALYRAKETGRNRIEVHAEPDNVHSFPKAASGN